AGGRLCSVVAASSGERAVLAQILEGAMARVTAADVQRMKAEKKKICVMTAYYYEMARIIDRAEPEMILVGDSGGRFLLGHEDNNDVTLEEMIMMTRAVVRGSSHALVIGDM